MARIRSPRHPSHNLEEAIEFARRIHDEDRQHPVQRQVAAQHMGFSGISGTSDRALSSLIHFGLAEKVVKGEMRVTDLALSILHPDNDGEWKGALQEAGFNPELFKELRDRYPEAPPSSASLESFLSRSGFAPAAIRPAAKAYLETCHFLQRNGAYESDGTRALGEAESGEQPSPVEPKTVHLSNPIPIAATPHVGTSALRGDVFVLSGGGEIIANLPDAMSSRDYEDLKDWLELMIRKAGRKVIQVGEVKSENGDTEEA